MAKETSHLGIENFETFFKNNFENIRQFIARYLHEEVIAKDLAQDTFVKIYERRHEFENEIHAKAYAYTIAKNLSLDFLKHEKVKLGYIDTYVDDEFDDRNFLTNITYIESMAIVKSALNHLSPRERDIITLSMDDKSNEEIARELEISINTVKTLKKRAYEKLRNNLSHEYTDLTILMILVLSAIEFGLIHK